jgi:hypothetical protein
MSFAIPMSFQYEWLELVTLKYGLSSLLLPLEHEDHVVGVHVARRLPRAVVVPLHTFAQVKVYTVPSRRCPTSRRAGHDLRRAALEVDDAAVDLAVGVERRSGRVHAGVEVLGLPSEQ